MHLLLKNYVNKNKKTTVLLQIFLHFFILIVIIELFIERVLSMEEHITLTDNVQVTDKASSILQTIKESGSNLLHKTTDAFKNYKGNLVEIAIYAGVGFVIGFLFKKYVKYIALIILCIVGLVILQQFDLVHTNINWQKIQDLFNIQPIEHSLDTQTFHAYFDWVKANFVFVLSTSIGFFIGLKLG